jgi:hypothetical protein
MYKHPIELNRVQRNVIKHVQKDCLRSCRQYINRLGWRLFPILITQLRNGEKILDRGQGFFWKENPWGSLRDPVLEYGEFQFQGLLLEHYFGAWSGIGLKLGADSGIICLDFDCHHGSSNEWIVKTYVPESELVYDRSRSGGFHFYFKYDSRITNHRNSKLDFEVRTDGSFIIIPPSVVLAPRPSCYNWIQSPLERPLPQLPDALYDFIYSKRESASKRPQYKERDNITPAQQIVLEKLVTACKKAQKGERSERDFALVSWCIKIGLNVEKAWTICSSLGKFSERTRESYFDPIWQKVLLNRQ